LPGLAWDCDPLTHASCIAGVTGAHHQTQLDHWDRVFQIFCLVREIPNMSPLFFLTNKSLFRSQWPSISGVVEHLLSASRSVSAGPR
jgi:hypothetical protein